MTSEIDRDFWFLEEQAVWEEFSTLFQDVEEFQPTPQDLEEMAAAFNEMESFEQEFEGLEF